MTEILWVGVGFDPDVDSLQLSNLHDLIGEIWSERAGSRVWDTTQLPKESGSVDELDVPEIGTLLDVFDALGSRIGFGIRVGTVAEGRKNWYTTEAWLRNKDIKHPVHVYAWSPEDDRAPREQSLLP